MTNKKLNASDVAEFFKALRDAKSGDEAHDLLVSDHAEEIEEAITRLKDEAREYTFDHMDAGACMWEHVLLQMRPRHHSNTPWHEYREAYGMCQLRETVIKHAPILQEAYERAVENGYDNAFDWEFVPKYMEDHVTRILT